MTPPPKRSAKKTTPASTPTTPIRTPDLTELREGVVSLAERVNNLASALTTVNEIQKTVMQNEKRAQENAKKVVQIESDLIPRSEHEARWKKEQAELIRTRLSIRRQTYIVGALFFLLSMLALAVTTGLLLHDIHDRNTLRCTQSNDYKKQDKQLWQEVMTFPPLQKLTPEQQKQQDANVKKFNAFLDRHDAIQKC